MSAGATTAEAEQEVVTTECAERPGVIGVLLGDFEPFGTEVLQGVATALRGTRFDLLAGSGGSRRGRAGWEHESLRRLAEARVEGAILVTPSGVITSSDLPLVVVDPLTAQTELHSVATDDFGGAQLATSHLIGLGHRRIGFVAGRPDLESSHRRGAGYQRALADAGLSYDPALVRVGYYRHDPSLVAAHELLLLPDRPTAVFAANDASAIAVIEAARALGLSVPGQLSVVGYDDVPDASRVVPALTTVRQPLHRVGRAAARALLTLIDGGSVAEPHVRLRNKLVLRGSTAPPAEGSGPG
ncbi:substrate-binding domain-containing protein [Rathayibacter sp. VKM Ac-2801]|uniref:substrate-binding domain-containing protein n=1 Tax=Rathayibacter sp. VKM Ac-2801 TaxID=2609255 RepID=UPI00131F9C96|nr:substrate-binding domain-containing protein [Rathayibacter sp. VKM Ac-2801]QHC69423.1 substrate-binding domain-containing protein [Rathayibacter sp. VKM Ac-2801]